MSSYEVEPEELAPRSAPLLDIVGPMDSVRAAIAGGADSGSGTALAGPMEDFTTHLHAVLGTYSVGAQELHRNLAAAGVSYRGTDDGIRQGFS